MKPKFTQLVLAKLSLLLVVYFTFAGCKKSFPDDEPFTPPYDINVTLEPVVAETHGWAKSSGFVKFRQDKDTARIITLETWVTHLAPKHAYFLQRAVNPITD